MFAFWRGKRPILKRQIRDAQLVERLVDLEAEEARREATLSRKMAPPAFDFAASSGARLPDEPRRDRLPRG